MKHWREVSVVLVSSCVAVAVHAADPGVQLIGRALVSGTAHDLSGLDGQPICQKADPSICVDQATLGGWGSGITYTGRDNVFLAAPDRGPFDGRTDVPYQDRVDYFYIAVDPTKPVDQAITIVLLDTRLLVEQQKKNAVPFLGDSSAFANRLDPEAIVATSDKGFIVSDEYGPHIYKFSADGVLQQRIPVPAHFLIRHPSGDVYADGTSKEIDPDLNPSGRQANRGMEGLAITPDGSTLVGLMQNSLIQDNALGAEPAGGTAPPSRIGFNSRLLAIDLKSGKSHEYVYTIDAINQGRGQNDLLAINDHEFLVLERDNRSLVPTPPNTAAAPALKRLYRIDLNEAGLTDVSSIYNLPTGANFNDALANLAAANIKGVTKHLFLDLLNPDYKVNGTPVSSLVAEKVEGLAWGPDLADGRHLLLVTTDNDLYATGAGLPTQVYAFAIDDAAAGIEYVPQQMKGPFLPPGQVRKAIR